MSKTRLDEMRDQVREWHRENPEVWRLFCKFTFQLIERGFEHYSAQGVWERIRWETAEASTDGSTWKANNNYCAFYARAFMRKYPQYDGFFRTRRQASADAPATNLPPLEPKDYGEARA